MCILLCKLIRKQEEKNVSTIFISSIFLKPNPMKNVISHKLDNPTFSVIEGNLAGELTTDKKPEKNI